MARMASMGTGIVDESSTATAPAPQKPSLMMAGRTMYFHLFKMCAKNCFNHGPLPAPDSSIQKDHCTVWVFRRRKDGAAPNQRASACESSRRRRVSCFREG